MAVKRWNGTAWVTQAGSAPGVAAGGTANQVLKKIDSTDYNTTWGTIAGAVYQASAPSSPQTGDVWVDSDAVAGVLNQNDYLLKADAIVGYATKDEGVRRYASPAARASAIPSPTAGMITYLDDTGSESPTSTIAQLETYTGSGWQTPYGLTQVADVTLTAITSATISNVFTSAYANYRIIITGQGSFAQDLFIRGASSGVPDASANYQQQNLKGSSTTVTAPKTTNGTRFEATAYDSGGLSPTWVEIYAPQLASNTGYLSMGGRYDQIWLSAGQIANTTVYDGINFTTGTGTFTGTVRIYGFRNN